MTAGEARAGGPVGRDDAADRQAVVAVTVAYCWALDGREWDRLDQVFTVDAQAELGGWFVGIEAIKGRVRTALDPLDVSQHMIGTHEVQIDGDRATSRCYLHAQHVRAIAGDQQQLIVAGRYEDELVRTPEGWRIARRVLTPLWTSGNPAVLGL
jgi:hypothetical protein